MLPTDKNSTEIAIQQPNPFEAFGRAATRSNFPFLKFAKGDYLAGQYNDDVPLGSEFVVMMNTLSTGWVIWQNNFPAQKIMGLLIDGFVPPKRNELGHNDPEMWERDDDGDPKDPAQLTNEVVFIGHKDMKVIYTFTSSSKGGLGALGEISKEYGTRLRLKPDEFPVIKLDVGSYQHPNRSYGRIKVPKFVIVGWVNKAPYLKAGEGGGVDAAPADEMANAIEHEKKERATKTGRRGAADVPF